jgi:hypothetical protein
MNETNNKLLAQFMQWEIVENQGELFVDCHPEKEQAPLQLLNEMFKDWESIMVVYNNLSIKLDVAWEITSKGVRIYTHAGQPIGDFDGTWKINCPKNVLLDAYRAVVEFIKWYNKNK